jgi:hypothetical protein
VVTAEGGDTKPAKELAIKPVIFASVLTLARISAYSYPPVRTAARIVNFVISLAL